MDVIKELINLTGTLPLYCGTWDAGINKPQLQSGNGDNGQFFKISHDGKTNLDGITHWKMGDIVFFANGCWNGLSHTSIYKVIEGGKKK